MQRPADRDLKAGMARVILRTHLRLTACYSCQRPSVHATTAQLLTAHTSLLTSMIHRSSAPQNYSWPAIKALKKGLATKELTSSYASAMLASNLFTATGYTNYPTNTIKNICKDTPFFPGRVKK